MSSHSGHCHRVSWSTSSQALLSASTSPFPKTMPPTASISSKKILQAHCPVPSIYEEVQQRLFICYSVTHRHDPTSPLSRPLVGVILDGHHFCRKTFSISMKLLSDQIIRRVGLFPYFALVCALTSPVHSPDQYCSSRHTSR